ncbi:MAG TPA: efflux RND transporter periplasmic adaptor subunit [Acidobacteriaceae bacterium]|nr:efflux RND transporter periplasmic adaptor subunit [Acidobacteriaceae bacterium]
MAIVTTILVGILAALAFSLNRDAVEVLTAPATYADLSQKVTTNGTVIPISEFQARAFWPGVVEKVHVHLGQRVQPGQLLVTMKDPFAISRLTAAKAALEAARLGNENLRKGGTQDERITLDGDLKHAQQTQMEAAKTLAALKQLRTKGAASEAEIAAAQEKLDAANTTVQTLVEKTTKRFSPLDLSSSDAHVIDERANVDAAKIQFNNANISSPIAGTVYSVKVVPYDWVPVGTDLIRVANLNNVEVRAYFDEPEIGKLNAGQPVEITWDGRPGRVWHGHIKQAPIAATALGPRSVGECLIAVDDAREDLLPNTNVSATVITDERRHVLSIPHGALRGDGQENYVFQLLGGSIHRTAVKIGVTNVDRAEIVRGLSDGDVVVLNAEDNRELRDGMPAKPARNGPAHSGFLDMLRSRVQSHRAR